MAETWTVLKILQWSQEYFTKKGIDAPRLTADLLLSHVLGLDRVKLYMNFDRPLNKDELASYRALIERRVAGEPTAYLTGVREFFGRSFRVDTRVLVPRPETERLVEVVLDALPKDQPRKVVDLGTGTCCIAATIAAERPQARVTAVELLDGALEVAKTNLTSLGLTERVELLAGDLFSPLAGRSFDVVTSNPPYIAEGEFDQLPREVQHEPKQALLAGPKGTEIIERIADAAQTHLEPGGLLALEIGDDQKAVVQELLKAKGYSGVQVLADWAGKDRIAIARW
jgi:release factor glutamine methyltransferase